MAALKMTIPTQLVLRTLLDHPRNEMYGLELGTATGLATGSIHPILARLERAGWVESHWEDADPVEEKRPRRRYYRLSREGVEQAQSLATRHMPKGWRP